MERAWIMTTYRWLGMDSYGELQRGEIKATDVDDVLLRLRAQHIRPLADSIRPIKGQVAKGGLKSVRWGEKVSTKDLVLFTRQLAAMVDSDLLINQALEILAQQTENPTFATVLTDIKNEVRKGADLAEALRKHPDIFDSFYTNMIAAAERGGVLDVVLLRLAHHLEKGARTRKQLKTAMIYPVSVVTAAIAVAVILLIWVVPALADTFTSFGKALPLPTQIVITLSDFAIAYFWHAAVGLLGVGLALRLLYRTGQGKLQLDRLFLASPIFGHIVRKAAIARFTRALHILLSSGVPILESLSMTAKTSGNRMVEQVIFAARQHVNKGGSLTQPLRDSTIFPSMVCQMINVGEETGALDTMLLRIADFYDDEVDQEVANIMILIEPLVIFFLGVVISGFIVSMYLPIFQLGTILS